MRIRPPDITLAGMTLAGLWLAAATPALAARYDAEAAIQFYGTSTLHDFHGTVAARPFAVEVSDASNPSTLKVNGTVQVQVSDMLTRNKKRDSNMHKMLGQARYPLIEGTVEDAVLTREGETTIKLALRIRDCTQEIDATVTGWTNSEDQVSFDIAFPVSLEAFGLEPPSELGLIRVGNRVDVRCHVGPPAVEDQ